MRRVVALLLQIRTWAQWANVNFCLLALFNKPFQLVNYASMPPSSSLATKMIWPSQSTCKQDNPVSEAKKIFTHGLAASRELSVLLIARRASLTKYLLKKAQSKTRQVIKVVAKISPNMTFPCGQASANPGTPSSSSKFASRQRNAVDNSEMPK